MQGPSDKPIKFTHIELTQESVTLDFTVGSDGSSLRYSLIRLPQQRQHELDANLVTRVVGVNAVLDPDVIARLAVGRQHRVPQIDEVQVHLRSDVILHQLVRLPATGSFVPTGG